MDRRALTRVDIIIDNNAWWDDAFQFGDPLDFTWTLNGAKFFLQVKKNEDDVTPLMSLTSDAGQIVVQDPIVRVIGLLVPDTYFRPLLPEGKYRYDLLMVQNSNGQTDGLMYGELHVAQGVTLGPS